MELRGSEAIDLMRLIQTDGAHLDKFIAGAILRRLALQPGGANILPKTNDQLLSECKIIISPQEFCAEFGSATSKSYFSENGELNQE